MTLFLLFAALGKAKGSAVRAVTDGRTEGRTLPSTFISSRFVVDNQSHVKAAVRSDIKRHKVCRNMISK